MSRQWIGYWFLFATIALYAGIGIMSRTVDAAEYYVAGRRVPAFFNGMATGADWMSAASFIGMAGTLYLSGFDGLAFVMGWTGGYVLVALFLAPYLRKFGQFTIPDFLGARYGGNIVRSVGIFAAILCSFTYVVAQIYGVGLITSRFTGLEFGIGVFVGLAGILVCSFLGGMRAVTWTQVAQYIILIIAYLTPVVWLGVKHTGIPVPQFAYGPTLQKVGELREEDHRRSEGAARRAGSPRPPRPRLPPRSRTCRRRPPSGARCWRNGWPKPRRAASQPTWRRRSRTRSQQWPTDPDEGQDVLGGAQRAWPRNAAPPRPHADPFPGANEQARNTARLNFLGIVFCMMFGTAALPHILMRYYTTPSVRQARTSVFWSLFFIFLLYFTAPASRCSPSTTCTRTWWEAGIAELPAWAAAWRLVDPTLLTITDLNFDGIVQLAEIVIGGDIIVLATPEIAGLPYVVSGLVAAGGLAAALSTADGLLLTIANALGHDLYYKMIAPTAPTARRVAVSKALLLVVAIIAAWVTSYKPGNILFLVGAAFSLAASAFFPALVLGVFWKRANKWGAITGMVAGLGVCMYYMSVTYPFFRDFLGVTAPIASYQWFGMNAISAGVFGVPVGLLTIWIVSLLTPAPDRQVQELVDHVRYPVLAGDIETRGT